MRRGPMPCSKLDALACAAAVGTKAAFGFRSIPTAPSPGGPPLPGLLGQELARKLKAPVHDKLRLISPQIGLDTLQGADPSQAAAPPLLGISARRRVFRRALMNTTAAWC